MKAKSTHGLTGTTKSKLTRKRMSKGHASGQFNKAQINVLRTFRKQGLTLAALCKMVRTFGYGTASVSKVHRAVKGGA